MVPALAYQAADGEAEQLTRGEPAAGGRIGWRYRWILEDQPGDPLGLLLGDERSDVPAERMPDQCDLPQLQRVQQPGDIVAEPGQRVRHRPRTGTVPAKVGG